MAVEQDGLVKRGNAVSRTLDKLTAPGHTADERLGAGVKVVAVTGTVAIAAEQLVIHGGSALAAIGTVAEPGLIAAAVAIPVAAVASLSAHGSAEHHDSEAQRWPTLEHIYHDADKAEAIRKAVPTTFRRIAAGTLVGAGTAAVVAGALGVGPALGLGHTGVAPQDAFGVAEVLAAVGGTAALTARHWSRRAATNQPAALGE